MALCSHPTKIFGFDKKNGQKNYIPVLYTCPDIKASVKQECKK
jgi:hypothetical protein